MKAQTEGKLVAACGGHGGRPVAEERRKKKVCIRLGGQAGAVNMLYIKPNINEREEEHLR